MNVWRWIGVSLLLLAAVCWLSTTNPTAFAGGKDKDAQKDKDKDKDKDKGKDDKGKDDKGKDKDKDKGGKEVVQPVAGDKMPFNAFTGNPFYQEQETETEQTMTVMGQKVVQKQKQTFMILWTPKGKKDADFQVVQKIVGVKMNIDIGGNKITYDSTLPNPKNPMTDFFEALMKEELTFIISPELAVKSVEGRQKFVDNLVAINPQMQGLLKAILSDEALKKMAEPTWWAYPKDGVPGKVGNTWNREAVLKLGPIGDYKTDFKFTYQGEKSGKDTIDIATSLTYTAPAAADKTGLPFVITKAELKGDNGKGTAIFDRSKGRFESTTMNMDLKGDLEIEVGNMQTKVALEQTQKSKSLTHDNLPKGWEKSSK